MHQAYFVYKLTCRETGKSYIGVSNNPKRRLWEHRKEARLNPKFVIHHAMRKHGPDTFDMTVLCESNDKKHAYELLEPQFIKEHNTLVPHGYNMTTGGEGSPTLTISDETRRKRSESAKAQYADPTQKANHKVAASKANQDPKKRQHIAEAARKRWSDPVFIAKMKAKYATPEQREKKRKARAIRGTILHTDATKEKIRQSKLGSSLSEEHKDKIRQSMKTTRLLTPQPKYR
jgi:group I intron endonuclease